jgi:plastocyanin
MKKYLPIAAVAIIVAVIVAIALGGKNSNSNKSTDMSNMNQNSSANSNKTVSTDKVSIANFSFSPSSITVKKGATVTWTNNDTSEHTVSADTGNAFESGALDKGKTFSFTFATAGTFKYHCSFHPNMHGTVTVTE